MAAALEYETAQALAKAKRDALNARIAAHDPAAKRIGKGAARKASADYEDVPLDAPLTTRADAIATARQRIGLAWRERAKGKDPRAGAGNAQYKHQVTEAELMRCIRGEVRPAQLAKQLKVDAATIYGRIKAIIGPAGKGDSHWKPGVGFTRNGKPAIELLRQVKGLRLPASQPPPAVTKRKQQPVGKGTGRRAAEIPEADLQRLVDKRTTGVALARKHKCGMSTIYKQLAVYRQRSQGKQPAATMTAQADKVTDDELDDIVAGNLSVAAVAARHLLSAAAVAQRVQRYRTENLTVDRMLGNVKPEAVVAHAATNNGAPQS